MKPFNHPFVQCAIMFIGEILCLGVYAVKVLYNKRKQPQSGEASNENTPVATQEDKELIEGGEGEKKLRTDINPFLLAIPAAFDTVASTLMNIALTMVAASVY